MTSGKDSTSFTSNLCKAITEKLTQRRKPSTTKFDKNVTELEGQILVSAISRTWQLQSSPGSSYRVKVINLLLQINKVVGQEYTTAVPAWRHREPLHKAVTVKFGLPCWCQDIGDARPGTKSKENCRCGAEPERSMLLATKLKGVSLKYALTSDMEMQNLEFSHLFSDLLWSTVSSLCSLPLCNGNILVSLFGGNM